MLARVRTTALAGETSAGADDICCSVLSMGTRCEVWGADEEGSVYCLLGGESGNILED